VDLDGDGDDIDHCAVGTIAGRYRRSTGPLEDAKQCARSGRTASPPGWTNGCLYQSCDLVGGGDPANSAYRRIFGAGFH